MAAADAGRAEPALGQLYGFIAHVDAAADRRWERAVRRAHGDICVITGRRGTAPHHLHGYDIHPELRLLLQNGVLLTHRLHRAFHDAYGFGGNTYAQFVASMRRTPAEPVPSRTR